MSRHLWCALLAAPLVTVVPAHAQISRHPTGVNVNAMGATTVFVSFGNLDGRVPADALWCGALVPAAPDIGDRCDPATLFGSLPTRYDLARPSGNNGLTDIMSIPASVARRAYQAAARGESSEFYYVRRFIDPAGGPDEYVAVTCRMTDGGARAPFALTDVRLAFASEEPVVAVRAGERVPPVTVAIKFNGTGRLRGRWEIVRPGEDPPTKEDLLPEASLPLELRVSQRRFTEIERFDVFVPPVGEFTLAGPDPAKLPSAASGEYLLLLRIEPSDDKEGDSDLAAALAGNGLVHTGGVAGFFIPPLRYTVGSVNAVGVAAAGFRQLQPAPGARLDPAARMEFRWAGNSGALFHRIEIGRADGSIVLEAILPGGEDVYRAPTWLRERVAGRPFRWRVVSLGTGGRTTAVTPWREAAFVEPS